MKPLFSFILLLVSLATWAQGQQKMSHDIRQMVVHTFMQARQTAKHAPNARQHDSIRVMIRFRNAKGEAVLSDYDSKIITQIGDIYVADIPCHQLGALADDERVTRIENHTHGKILMDVSPQWINTPDIYTDLRLSQAYTGQGVMLGIIDTIIELTHPNFFTPDGSQLRITCFLDQLANGPDDPERLVRIAGIIIRIPGQHCVPVLKLVPQAFQDFLLGLFRPIIEQRHGDL